MSLLINPSTYIGQYNVEQPASDLSTTAKLSDVYSFRTHENDSYEKNKDTDRNNSNTDDDDDRISNYSDRSKSNVDEPITGGDKEVKIEKLPGISEEFFDYKLILLFGLLIFLVAGTYLYWNSTCCDIPEKDEVNMTMQYAIDKTSQMHLNPVLGMTGSENTQVFVPPKLGI
jgi:hypothetical protein